MDAARREEVKGAAATETERLPGPATAVETRLARPWRVIVHDDPVTLMSYVTAVFMRVFGYPRPKAESLMLEVHTRGCSAVWAGERERAEAYVVTLHGYHLLATMEPVGG